MSDTAQLNLMYLFNPMLPQHVKAEVDVMCNRVVSVCSGTQAQRSVWNHQQLPPGPATQRTRGVERDQRCLGANCSAAPCPRQQDGPTLPEVTPHTWGKSQC